MPTYAASVVNAIFRTFYRHRMTEDVTAAQMRALLDRPFPLARGATAEPATLGGVPGEWVTRADGDGGTGWLLYVHGGGFAACSPATHRGVTAAFALRGWRVFAVDYRRPGDGDDDAFFPAPLDDVGAAWAALADAAPLGARLAIAGDSAGGNLALAATLDVVAGVVKAVRAPDAVLLFSPVTDLTCASPSMTTNVATDHMTQPGVLKALARLYLGEDRVAELAASPRASPLFSPHLGALPPVAVFAAAGELLLDDATRLTTAIRKAGGRAALSVIEDMAHAWPTVALMPEARATVGAASRFAAAADAAAPETFDVVIVGAGISGVCAAHRLRQARPGVHVTLLEARQGIGGTWDLHKYPGVRSDSDMPAFGLPFGGGWRGGDTMADGADILAHIRDVAQSTGVAPLVRYGHRVVTADWDSRAKTWRLAVEVAGEGDGAKTTVTMEATYVYFCAGYYSYDAPYRPPFPNEASFPGPIIHPQHWPADYDPRGRTIAVIGSGATAVTLVPALVRAGAAHVVMLQRSPTHVVALPRRDWALTALAAIPVVGTTLARWAGAWRACFMYVVARARPDRAAAKLRALAAADLGPDVPVDPHFTPRHAVWDERVCVAADGDLFAVLRGGQATVVTDEVASFDEQGIVLKSGARVDADTIVTATGLTILALGGTSLSLDGGPPIDLGQQLVYRHAMMAGIPNAFFAVGYTSNAWTLRADLTAQWVAKVVTEATRSGARVVVAKDDPSVKRVPLLNIKPGYLVRGAAALPSAGDRGPYRVQWSWPRDVAAVWFGRVREGVLQFLP